MPQRQPSITDLVCWWEMEENGGTAFDSHGSNDLAQFSGTITRGNGKIGYCRNFEKDTTHYFKGGSSLGISGRVSHTIGLWIKPESIGTVMTILYEPGYFRLCINANGKLEAAISEDGTLWSTAEYATPLLPATWYFVAIVIDHVTSINLVDMSVYVNNVLVSGNGFEDYGGYHGSDYLYVGASDTNTNHFDGKMDEMFVFSGWDTVMSADEISWLYNEGNGRTYSDMQSLTSGIIAMF